MGILANLHVYGSTKALPYRIWFKFISVCNLKNNFIKNAAVVHKTPTRNYPNKSSSKQNPPKYYNLINFPRNIYCKVGNIFKIVAKRENMCYNELEFMLRKFYLFIFYHYGKGD